MKNKNYIAFSSNFKDKLLYQKAAFSLVEMLMALLVASLLMTALAPVMTRKMNENVNISGSLNYTGKSEIKEIDFGDSKYCPNITYDSSGNPLYCEGEFVVPDGYRNITVMAIGGGGGGGTAPTAGFMEFTTAGSTNNFTVPVMVNELEATLIGGGAPGGAGGQVKRTEEFTTVGSNTFNIPAALKGRYGIVTMCGGGGAGGAASAGTSWNDSYYVQYPGAAGGGSGGFYENRAVTFTNADSTEVFVGGGGGRYDNTSHSATNGSLPLRVSIGVVWCDLDYFMDKNSAPEERYNGPSAEDGSGGAGGGTTNPYNSGRKGGNGGNLNGGSGGAYYGAHIGLVGGGGGGGGASRLGKSGDSHYLYVGGGGGGGGEGIVLGKIDSNGSYLRVKSSSGGGGGGGGGTNLGGNGGASFHWDGGCGARGGGGGKPNGNIGGNSGCNNTQPATSGAGGESPLSTYPNKCAGGHGEGYNKTFESRQYDSGWNGGSYFNGKNPRPTGLDGIVTITYLDYGPGGSGGGAAHIVPLQKVLVTPAETLNITIGKGLEGSKAGKTNSDGTIKQPEMFTTWDNKAPVATKITRNNIQILGTPISAGRGLSGGSYTGEVLGQAIGDYYAAPGWITNGVEPYNRVSVSGFTSTNAKTAGNTDFVGHKTYADKTSGGDGGKVITPWFECTPGIGARTSLNSSYAGGNASGYGCGGGGGYGLSNGGNGSGGYARISWNMYWNTVLNSGKGAYEYTEIGAGGGGASGNVVIDTVRVNKNQTIKVRIGAGGIGAKVVDNQIMPATNGGTTIFGNANFVEIKAGGGGAGTSPSVNTDRVFSNGKGGSISNICHTGSTSYINNKNHCKKGLSGESPGENGVNISIGGVGAAFSYSYNNKTYSGTGGLGGVQATEESNSRGKNAEGIGAGGGGAALLKHNRVANSANLNHPQGGNGAPGKIILQLWE